MPVPAARLSSREPPACPAQLAVDWSCEPGPRDCVSIAHCGQAHETKIDADEKRGWVHLARSVGEFKSRQDQRIPAAPGLSDGHAPSLALDRTREAHPRPADARQVETILPHFQGTRKAESKRVPFPRPEPRIPCPALEERLIGAPQVGNSLLGDLRAGVAQPIESGLALLLGKVAAQPRATWALASLRVVGAPALEREVVREPPCTRSGMERSDLVAAGTELEAVGPVPQFGPGVEHVFAHTMPDAGRRRPVEAPTRIELVSTALQAAA
jgi:hypothetical protein